MHSCKKILLISRAISSPRDEWTKNIMKWIVDTRPAQVDFFTNKENAYKHWFTVYTENSIWLWQKMRLFFFLLFKANLKTYDNIVIWFSPSKVMIVIFKLLFLLKNFSKDHLIQFIPSLRKWCEVSNLLLSKRVITISDYTADLLEKSWIEDILSINPFSLSLSSWLDEETAYRKNKISYDETKKYVLYLGEYSERVGSFPLLTDIISSKLSESDDIVFILACRIFSEKEKAYEWTIKNKFAWDKRVIFMNHVPKIYGLIAMVDACVFPWKSAGNKFDIPLVLLEWLMMWKHTFVSDYPPFNEVYKYDKSLAKKYLLWDEALLRNDALSSIAKDDSHSGDLRTYTHTYFSIEKASEKFYNRL